jgi:IS1 family transposase
MWLFVGDKVHQCWFWWVIDYFSGILVVFWFGGRDAGNFKVL